MLQSDRQARLFRTAPIAGIELCHSTLDRQALGRHWHEEYQIGICEAGLGKLACRGSVHAAGTHCLLLLAPGEVHGAECQEAWSVSQMYVSPSLVERWLGTRDGKRGRLARFVGPVVKDKRWWSRMRRLLRALEHPSEPPFPHWEQQNPQTRLSLETRLAFVLAGIFERYADSYSPPAGREQAKLADCQGYLESHYAEEVSLETLAEISNLGSYQLLRSFKLAFGLPPHAFQIQLRLNKAKGDLRAGATPLAAALAHGFYDQSHFSKHFRRSFGLSPGRYQKMLLAT